MVLNIGEIMIKRQLKDVILKKLKGGNKAIVVTGPRQTGKTTLIRSIVGSKRDYLFLDCDDMFVRDRLSNPSLSNLEQIISSYNIVFIDEAQRVKNIGLTLKLITDNFKDVKLLVTGSSSLNLGDEINEPLTGRKWSYYLYPVSWKEYSDNIGSFDALKKLEQRLIYGMYPEVINNPGDEIEILRELSGSYLFKDLLTYKGIKKPEVLSNLLKAIAYQVGNEVSYNELAKLVQIDKNTVQNYIQLLEDAFVLFRLNPLKKNLRKEISSKRKIYFLDNGILCSILSNYNTLDNRDDVGALWENFIISERFKQNHYQKNYVNAFYWRTITGQEIDYVEEKNEKYEAYEFKWNPNRKVKFPAVFTEHYNSANIPVHRENFHKFIM